MRILQIEDDEATAKSVELMLKANGYSCHTTGQGKQAVKWAKDIDFDVILLDIMLPDIDGYEVLKELDKAEIDTPVLIQTGLLSRESRADGRSLGADDVLVKPFTKAELIELIQKLADRPRKRKAESLDDLPIQVEAEALPHGKEERRKQRRFKTLKTAKIVHTYRDDDHGTSELNCIILNMSAGGAALQPSTLYAGPKLFALRVTQSPIKCCRVRWQYGNKIGVEFVPLKVNATRF